MTYTPPAKPHGLLGRWLPKIVGLPAVLLPQNVGVPRREKRPKRGALTVTRNRCTGRGEVFALACKTAFFFTVIVSDFRPSFRW